VIGLKFKKSAIIYLEYLKKGNNLLKNYKNHLQKPPFSKESMG
jgi:hypothetical protein